MSSSRNILGEQTIRQSARAILIDNADNLILFRRNKPGRPTYWATPGGSVDKTDRSLKAALQRELVEELNARATNIAQVFICSSPSADDLIIEYFFVARLVKMDESASRSGAEFQNPNINGTYEVDRIDLHQDELESLNLKPELLKQFILANKDALILLAGMARKDGSISRR